MPPRSWSWPSRQRYSSNSSNGRGACAGTHGEGGRGYQGHTGRGWGQPGCSLLMCGMWDGSTSAQHLCWRSGNERACAASQPRGPTVRHTCSAASTSASTAAGTAGRMAAALSGSRKRDSVRSRRRSRWRTAMRRQKYAHVEVPGGRVLSQARLQPGGRNLAHRWATGDHNAAPVAGAGKAVLLARPPRQTAPPAQPETLLLPQLLRCFHCLQHGLAREGKVHNVAGRAYSSSCHCTAAASCAAADNATGGIADASPDDQAEHVVQNARGNVQQAQAWACALLSAGLGH